MLFIVGREVLTPLFYEDLPILPTPAPPSFKFYLTPQPPLFPRLSSRLQPSCPLLFLLSCFFDWMGDRPTFDVPFYLKILGICTCQFLGPWCVFYATRCQIYRALTHNVVFCWYSNLISHTNKHAHKDTQHTLASRLANLYK